MFIETLTSVKKCRCQTANKFEKSTARTMLQEVFGHIVKTGKKPLKTGGRGTLLNGEVIIWGL